MRFGANPAPAHATVAARDPCPQRVARSVATNQVPHRHSSEAAPLVGRSIEARGLRIG